MAGERAVFNRKKLCTRSVRMTSIRCLGPELLVTIVNPFTLQADKIRKLSERSVVEKGHSQTEKTAVRL